MDISTETSLICLFIANAMVIIYNYWIFLKIKYNIKKLSKNDVSGQACFYWDLVQLIPINFGMIMVNLLCAVLYG